MSKDIFAPSYQPKRLRKALPNASSHLAKPMSLVIIKKNRDFLGKLDAYLPNQSRELYLGNNIKKSIGGPGDGTKTTP